MRPYWDLAGFVNDSHELCHRLSIQIPDTNSQQVYVDHKIRVKVY
jgi:hypothetical protein